MFEPGRAKHALNHIPPQRPPNGAVQGGVHRKLVATENDPGRILPGPGREHLALLDEGLVGQLGGAYDDHGPGPHPERDNGTVLGQQDVPRVLEEGLSGPGHLEEVPDDGPARRAWREVEFLGLGFAGE